jgi:16S rRNA (cytidine1402-2'-O)-methyltransferase
MQPGKLYLVPSLLGESSAADVLPCSIPAVLNAMQEFVVEDERSARRFLKKAGYTGSLDTVVMHVLNEHTEISAIARYLDGIAKGHNIAVISEAGCPAVADPGAALVKLAHDKNIAVVPLAGPSSILLALIASGMNGQQFSFNGYLPKEKEARIVRLKELERLALQKDQTQIFIETPYRNAALLGDILEQCTPATRLCIACDITLPTQFIHTRVIALWKKNVPDINKRPAVFLLGK